MNLTAILEEALQAVAVANDINALEDVRVAFMGKKGSITELLKSLGAMDPETRKTAGQQINDLKQQVQDALNTKRDQMQQAELAQLKAQLALAESRLQRVQQLKDTIPKKELDASASEVQSLKGQVAALAGGIGAKEALRAPTNGVIASSRAVAGKVFDAGDLLFEVVNPSVVRIDANWFDGATVPAFGGAKVSSSGQTIALKYLGASGAVRDQALTLAFENRELSKAQFATGQLLKVYAEQAEKIEGIAVASSALVKNAANQTAVWVKVQPETFEPRVVTTEPLDGQQVLITSGLKPFDRVVVQAASLINQIR